MVVLSLLLGVGLRLLHALSRTSVGLFLVALTLPDVILMPRGQLLDWLSVLLKNAVSLLLLWLGWKLYRLLTSIRQQPVAAASPGGAL